MFTHCLFPTPCESACCDAAVVETEGYLKIHFHIHHVILLCADDGRRSFKMLAFMRSDRQTDRYEDEQSDTVYGIDTVDGWIYVQDGQVRQTDHQH